MPPEIFHGYELAGEWKNSQCGKTAIATKSRKKYFLKRYQTPVAPINNGALDAKTFAHNKELFEKFYQTRKKINETIRVLTGPGGNIIIPSEEFIEGNQYVEASEFINGAVSEDDLEGLLASLPVKTKKLLMLTAAGALSTVHGKGIIHSDLKLKNVLLVKTETGNYVSKLIDFDSSYFEAEKPEEIVGDINYYSPELGAYSNAEDDKEEMGKKLTTQSDIFSLGLIFHFYLCGELPKPINLNEKLRRKQEKGKIIYCWVALLNGGDLQLSSEIKNPQCLSLIRDMLNIDPEARPKAKDVIKILQLIDIDNTEKVIEEPWPEHSISFDKAKLNADGFICLWKKEEAGQKKYELLNKDGRKSVLSKEEMADKGYVLITGFCDPRPEDNFEWNSDKLKKRGFIASTQKLNESGQKGYALFTSDGQSRFFPVANLVAMGYVTRKSGSSGGVSTPSVRTTPTPPPPSECALCVPWPEHKIEFDEAKIKEKGYIKVEQSTTAGVNGYKFTKVNGASQFIRVEMVIIQKMAKKV